MNIGQLISFMVGIVAPSTENNSQELVSGVALLEAFGFTVNKAEVKS